MTDSVRAFFVAICAMAFASAAACGGGDSGGSGNAGAGGSGGSAGAGGGMGGSPDAAVSPAWETLGADLGPGQDPVVMLLGSAPVVGYDVSGTGVLLSSWNGAAWSAPAPDPGSQNVVTHVYSGRHFCVDGDGVLSAFTDRGNGALPNDDPKFYDRVLVRRWSASGGWQAQNGGNEISLAVGEGSDQDPSEPAVACGAGVECAVAWIEPEVTAGNQDSDLDVWVSRIGAGLATRGAPIHRVAAQITDARTVGVALTPSGTAYVAHLEHAADASQQVNLYVTHADGTPLGGIVDTTIDGPTCAPALVAVGDTEIYVAWAATHDASYHHDVYVSRWDGNNWRPVGNGPVTAFPGNHFDSSDPDLILIDGAPVVAWSETGTSEPAGSEYVFVARFDGTGWNLIGNRINVDVAREAQDPTIAYDSGAKTLYAAFEEYVSGASHVFARRLDLR